MQTIWMSLTPVVLAAVAASGTDPNLLLKFAVQDVRIVPASSCCAQIVVTLKATVINRGNRVALVFVAENPEVVSATLGDAANRTAQGHGLVTEYAGPSVDTSAKWKAYAAKLEGTILDDAGVVRIPPGGSYEIPQKVAISVPNTLGATFYPKRPTLDELRKVPELWLSGVLSVWPANIERGQKAKRDSFGQRVRGRWRAAGDFALQPLVAEPVSLGRITDWESLRR
jgi:hypothetical protein